MTGVKLRVWVSVACFAPAIAVISLAGHAETIERVEHHGEFVHADNSKLCLSCHDGAIGPLVRYCTLDCDATQGHVIFRDYPPKGKERKFLSLSAAKAKGIIFENGQVTCISCHNVENPDRYHLVVDNKSGKLCVSCHIR